MPDHRTASSLIAAARQLCAQVTRLSFGPPVSHVYNPLHYAWPVHRAYLQQYGATRKRVIFLGMNPGPFGMAQTGVPFGEIAAVRDWMNLRGPIDSPPRQHPKRPIAGFDCPRSEISGRRLWGLFAQQFGTAPEFFRHHFVVNYCPLSFLEESGRNLTPDKIPLEPRAALQAACDQHLRRVIEILGPAWVIGVGDFAWKQLARIATQRSPAPNLGKIPHPSPASPAANRDWAGLTTRHLQSLGVW